MASGAARLDRAGGARADVSQQGSGSAGCLGCLGLLVVMALLAWPIDTVGNVVGWSSTTKGAFELASLVILVTGPPRWRRPVRPPTSGTRLRMVRPVRPRELQAVPRTTLPPGSITRREPIPAQLRFKVLQRDGFRCQYCGRGAQEDGVTLHADHVVPVVAGGETTEGNLLTACAACNLGKAARAVLP